MWVHTRKCIYNVHAYMCVHTTVVYVLGVWYVYCIVLETVRGGGSEREGEGERGRGRRRDSGREREGEEGGERELATVTM